MFSAQPGPATTAPLAHLEGEAYRLISGKGEVLDTPELPNEKCLIFISGPMKT